MSRLLIIGCGGVASVAIHKCCQNSEVFEDIMIASRTKSKCDKLKAELDGKTKTKISTAQVDADNVEELVALIKGYQPDAVLNVALPYQDLTIMDACLETGVHYIDTANYEAEDTEEVEEEPEALPVEETKEEIVEEKPTVSPVKQSEIAKHELKKFISKFTGIKGLDKQILKVMQNVLKVDTQPVKFVFVKGEVRSGKTTLAIEVIKVINRIIQRKNQKIAKIKGINLNDKSIDTLLETLKGSDVLIERVSDMDIEVFIEFVQKLREEGKPRVVIFEDEKTLAEAYLEELPEEYNSFTNVIDIKLKEIRDWASIAENYAKERGYTIDAMGTLALSAKIDQLKAITTVINNSHIEELIDEAIIDAEKFSVKRMFAKLFGKTDELTMLTEKNFTK